MSENINEKYLIPADKLRWCCDLDSYDYLKTGIIPRITGTVGQKRALDAMDFVSPKPW